MNLPNELIITIFNFIEKITDKRQFIKTCKLHNSLLKHLITNMNECELDYFRGNYNSVDIQEKELYHDIYLKKRNYCVEKFMMELCYDGYFNMIPLSYLTKNINNIVLIKLLIKYGKEDLLQIVIDGISEELQIIELAIESGHLNILIWAINNGYGWTTYASSIAALNGHLNILIWAKENITGWNGPRMDYVMTGGGGFISDICRSAAEGGQLHVLKWARNNGCDWDRLTCIYASRNGHLDVLKWAINNKCPLDIQFCFSNAINSDHLNVIKWLLENGYYWDGILDLALKNGIVNVINLLNNIKK